METSIWILLLPKCEIIFFLQLDFIYSIFILYMYSIYTLHVHVHIFYPYSIYWIQYIPLSLKQSVSNRVCVSFVDWTRWQFRARIGQRTPAKNTKPSQRNIWPEYISKFYFYFWLKNPSDRIMKYLATKERKLIFYKIKYIAIGLSLLLSSLKTHSIKFS